MYRIRLTDGRELEFPSIQEFSAAVHDGTVDEDASIYHRRAERWLPVREHPHYLQARAQTPAPPPKPAAAASEGDGVDLDAILSLLDAPASTAASAPRPASPPAEPAGQQPPAEERPVLESVDDLPVLRTGLEPAEAKDPEPVEESSPEPVEAGASETVTRIGDDIEEVPQEPMPIDALAPDDAPANTAPPATAHGAAEPPRDAFWNRAPEPTLAKLDLDPLGGDFGTARPSDPASREARRSRWAPPPEHERRGAAAAVGTAARAATVAAPLADADIPSHELVEATTPALPDTEVPELDWPSKVEHEPFVIGAHVRRKWMPVAAAVGAVLLIVAVILFRKSGEDPVEREGLPVAVDAASATPAPVKRTEDTADLVTPPAVPEGGPSASPALPPPAADTAADPIVMPAPPVGGRRLKVDPGVVTLAPINLGSGSGMRSHADLMRFYDQQYGQAQAALEAELVRAGFSRLFGISTLTTSDGLASGRRALTSGRSALSSYRTRQAMIERAYQDSLRGIGRRLGLGAGELAAWAPRPSRREPESTAALADPVLDGADEILELLQREIGRYRLQGNTLVFENRSTAERYAALRASVERGVAGLDQSHLTLRAVSRAIGTSLPLEVVN